MALVASLAGAAAPDFQENPVPLGLDARIQMVVGAAKKWARILFASNPGLLREAVRRKRGFADKRKIDGIVRHLCAKFRSDLEGWAMLDSDQRPLPCEPV